jgi:uncharacterized RDD family membrane protein YckC
VYAGLWLRLVALVVDLALLSLVFFPVTRIAKGAWIMSAADHRWSHGWLVTDPLCLAFLAVIFLYFVLLEGLAGGTVGKHVVGLRVVGTGGDRVGLGKALVRNILRLVDGLPVMGILGAILIATTSERTRLGDWVAGTRVVRIRPGQPS